jgi:hypothetical protein
MKKFKFLSKTFVLIITALTVFCLINYRQKAENFENLNEKIANTAADVNNTNLVADWIEREDAYEIALQLAFRTLSKKRLRKIKVLFFDKFEEFINRMDRFFYDWIEGALNHPDIEVTWWGIGFNPWDPKLSATENVKKRFGCGYFDLVVGHYDYMGPEMVLEDCGKTIMMQEIGDCHHRQCRALYT